MRCRTINDVEPSDPPRTSHDADEGRHVERIEHRYAIRAADNGFAVHGERSDPQLGGGRGDRRIALGRIRWQGLWEEALGNSTSSRRTSAGTAGPTLRRMLQRRTYNADETLSEEAKALH